MKIVKLHRKFKAAEHGFTCAMRFSEWSNVANAYEQKAVAIYGHSTMMMSNAKVWYGKFGAHDAKTKFRTYWLYFKNESDLTFLMLASKL